MTLAENLHTIWHWRWLVLIVVVVPTIAAIIFAQTRPTKYTTSIAFTVNRVNNQVNTKDYQYDGYYALQASDLFSDTVVSWFLTPSVIVDIYNTANVPADVTDLTALTSRFNIKKYSSQNIVVKYSVGNKDDAMKLATAIIQTVGTKAAQLNQTADAKAIYAVNGSTPVTVKDSKQLPIVGAVGFIIGAFLATLLIGLLEALRKPGSSHNESAHP